jgi:hypothetical protein
MDLLIGPKSTIHKFYNLSPLEVRLLNLNISEIRKNKLKRNNNYNVDSELMKMQNL